MMQLVHPGTVLFTACGRVYKSDPTPNPSLGRGLSQRNRNADNPATGLFTRTFTFDF